MNRLFILLFYFCLYLPTCLQTTKAQNTSFPQYNGDKFALIDAKNVKPLTPYKYESIGAFQDGLALSTARSEAGKLQYCFLNPAGKEVVPLTSNRMFDFVEGKARFKQGDKYGYLNPQGKAVLSARFIDAHDYKEGRAYVRDEDKNQAFLDEQGNAVVRFQEDYNYVEEFSDGLLLAGNCDNIADKYEGSESYFKALGKFAFYDKQGKSVFMINDADESINHATSFNKGVAIVAFINPVYDIEKPTLYGAINKAGKLILPLEYTYIERTQDGVLKLQKYDKVTYQTIYGLADNTGKTLMPCEYQFIFDSIGKYRLVQKKNETTQNSNGEYDNYPDRFGIADLQGKIIVKPIYKDIYLHQNGEFLALDSVITEPYDELKNMHPKSNYWYVHKNIAGKTLASMVNLKKFQGYEEISNDQRGSIETRAYTYIPITFHNKWALLNSERHEILTAFYDELAPFTTFDKGELAYREGKVWGYLDENFNSVKGDKYEHATNFGENNYAPVKKNKKWGIINKQKQEVIPYSYDSITPPVSHSTTQIVWDTLTNEMSGSDIYIEMLHTFCLPTGYFIAQKDKKWGIINWDGQIILPLQYEKIYDAFYNYVIISKNNKKGLVDYAGKELIPAKYDDIKVINDLVYAKINGKEGLFDLQNNEIAKPIYDTIFEPAQNFIRVVKDKKTGYLDYTGKELLPTIYDQVSGYLGKGYMTLIQNNKFGLADIDLKPIVPCEYDSLLGEDWKKYILVKKNNLYGLLHPDGKIAFPIKYEYIDNLDKENYSGNPRVMLAKLNKKWGILDTAGRAIVPFEYDEMKPDYERKTIVLSKKGKWGIVRGTGQAVLPFKYDEIGHVSKDIPIIGIKKKNKWGYISATGREIIKPTFDDASVFTRTHDEAFKPYLYAPVKKGKYWGVIDEAGKTIVPFQFDMIEYIPYNMTEPIFVWRNGTREQINFKGEPINKE